MTRRARPFSGQGAWALKLVLLMVLALYCAFIMSFRMPHLQPINHAANAATLRGGAAAAVPSAAATAGPRAAVRPPMLRLVLPGGGSVRIRLLPDLSAESVAYVKRIVALVAAEQQHEKKTSGPHGASGGGDGGASGGCSSAVPLAGANGPLCLYRMEGVPPAGAVDKDGNPGPPYALIQGRLAHAGARAVPASAVRSAGKPVLGAGAVAWAGGGTGPDFFISLAPHPEWGHGHVVWGQVEDLASLGGLRAEPRVQQSWGTVRVSLFAKPVPFKPAMEA